jgi:predicted small lipoprotein YifL
MRLLAIVLSCVLVVSLAACGNKGKLKAPAEIAREEAKKEKEAAKKEKKKSKDKVVSSDQKDGESSGFPLSSSAKASDDKSRE